MTNNAINDVLEMDKINSLEDYTMSHKFESLRTKNIETKIKMINRISKDYKNDHVESILNSVTSLEEYDFKNPDDLLIKQDIFIIRMLKAVWKFITNLFKWFIEHISSFIKGMRVYMAKSKIKAKLSTLSPKDRERVCNEVLMEKCPDVDTFGNYYLSQYKDDHMFKFANGFDGIVNKLNVITSDVINLINNYDNVVSGAYFKKTDKHFSELLPASFIKLLATFDNGRRPLFLYNDKYERAVYKTNTSKIETMNAISAQLKNLKFYWDRNENLYIKSLFDIDSAKNLTFGDVFGGNKMSMEDVYKLIDNSLISLTKYQSQLKNASRSLTMLLKLLHMIKFPVAIINTIKVNVSKDLDKLPTDEKTLMYSYTMCTHIEACGAFMGKNMSMLSKTAVYYERILKKTIDNYYLALAAKL